MAVSLAETKGKGAVLAPKIDDYVTKTLKPLLYGLENPGTPETSLLAVRNRLAHGGGMTQIEAKRLMDLWQAPFEAAIEAAVWLADMRVVGLDDEDTPTELRGTSDSLGPAEGVNREDLQGESDGVWLVREGESLALWPMALFGHPIVSTTDGAPRVLDENVAQIYVRRDVARLQSPPSVRRASAGRKPAENRKNKLRLPFLFGTGQRRVSRPMQPFAERARGPDPCRQVRYGSCRRNAVQPLRDTAGQVPVSTLPRPT
jgi:hypothetical protein